MNAAIPDQASSPAVLKWLTCLMFLMFAMTSDAVGSVIPKIVEEFNLSLTEAGAFHYVPMMAIAVGALFFGFLADRLGRKATILMGLAMYGVGSLLFAFGHTFGLFVGLLALSGAGISVFKIGALALIGDISSGPRQHTALMNTVEGFFGVGSIVGPLLVAVLISRGWSWTWLYVVAAAICAVLLIIAARVRYPIVRHGSEEPINLRRTLRMMRHPYALGFSMLIALYVAVEVAIYVWMPTYLQQYSGAVNWLPTYALTIFFVLRVAGRFLGIWILDRFHWASVLALFGVAIFACFATSMVLGANAGAWLLPASGLFMSMMYPTLNSKGISCYEKDQHGAVAGLILFFTAVAAALGPLAMAATSDSLGNVRYGFVLATLFALLLAGGLIWNWVKDPAAARLRAMEVN
jgi:DHA1 family quinolone resistance protein-like MFS transporter